jgi:glycosyl hydrolase family 64 (putative beta-1,3-glucanase)
MVICPRSLWFSGVMGATLLLAGACSDEGEEGGSAPRDGGGAAAGVAGSSGVTGAGGSSGRGGGTSTGGTSGSGSGGNSGSAGTATGGTGGNGGSAGSGPSDAATPDGFWDTSGIPAAKNVMIFKFLNRTNGKYQDSEIYWSFKSGSISELHSIAEQPIYDMPANSSGRLYFYLCAAGDATCAADPTKSKYYDFIEHTIGADQYNGNTTRVDAFGIKIAMRLHCADGFDRAVGENYATFQEDRAATFQAFIDSVPDEFDALAQPPHAPYRIVQPGAAGFDPGEPHEHYYDAFVDEMWAANGITIPKPGPNGSGLAAHPDLSAAIFRHVGNAPGTFDAAGKLLNKNLWEDASTFYRAAPANYYARFWHERAIDGKAYGFPYDDVGGYSSYVSHKSPQYLLVAVGW